MIYLLYSQLNINIFQYISFRAGVAFFVAFLISVFLMPRFITWAKSKKASQPISIFTPKTHQAKANTPTMGGMVFVTATVLASLLAIKLDNIYAILGILVLILFAAIGLKDDYAKISKSSNAGMSSKAKFIYQSFIALGISIILFTTATETNFYVPFYKYPLFDLGIFSIIFWTFVIVGTSNAVNITDGLDGLAAVPSIFSLISLSVIAYVTGNAILSGYLLIPKNIDVGEVAIIGAALIGSLIGFLWYNCHPAQVFMGDSGSLSLGAFIAYVAVITNSEVLLIVIGLIFVIETMSVILQIGSYKTRGKKVFLMAPIHHHFEVKGWAENKIIVRFWIISLMSNIIALISLKIR